MATVRAFSGDFLPPSVSVDVCHVYGVLKVMIFLIVSEGKQTDVNKYQNLLYKLFKMSMVEVVLLPSL